MVDNLQGSVDAIPHTCTMYSHLSSPHAHEMDNSKTRTIKTKPCRLLCIHEHPALQASRKTATSKFKEHILG